MRTVKLDHFPTPKWVKIMENPIKIHDLGGKKPYFWKHPYLISIYFQKKTTVKFGRGLRLHPLGLPRQFVPAGDVPMITELRMKIRLRPNARRGCSTRVC